jgi:MFS-type transporter involved in bile tolerance (Atg22 family)
MRRPSALQLVAWFFFVSGVLAAIGMAHTLLIARHVELDIDALGLWIGPGLLRREARYRTWAIRLLIVELCLAPIATLLLIFQPKPLGVKVFGHPVGTVHLSVALATLALLVGVSVWQYWVLSRADVRALFSATPDENSKVSIDGFQ